MRLVSIKPSDREDKKWAATFETDDGHLKTTHFGARGYQDYTQHHNRLRREQYRTRHRKDLLTRDPTAPGYLSWFLLWGPSTDLRRNITLYRQMFNL